MQPKLVADVEYSIQRQVDEEEEEFLQTKELTGHKAEIILNLESHIHSLKGGGQPLPESASAYFEPRFGRDFSQVRVHTDAKAAREVNARAFTGCRDVMFGVGQYVSDTVHGMKLLV